MEVVCHTTIKCSLKVWHQNKFDNASLYKYMSKRALGSLRTCIIMWKYAIIMWSLFLIMWPQNACRGWVWFRAKSYQRYLPNTPLRAFPMHLVMHEMRLLYIRIQLFSSCWGFVPRFKCMVLCTSSLEPCEGIRVYYGTKSPWAKSLDQWNNFM